MTKAEKSRRTSSLIDPVVDEDRSALHCPFFLSACFPFDAARGDAIHFQTDGLSFVRERALGP